MSVKVTVHPYLRKFTRGQETVEASGRTVGECIDDLEKRFPGIRQELCQEQTKLVDLYDIYVNSESCYPEDLGKRVKDGDELVIVTVVSGG